MIHSLIRGLEFMEEEEVRQLSQMTHVLAAREQLYSVKPLI